MDTLNQLNIWKKAIEFSTKIYSITVDFPHDEKYGLISQMRRSAVSIASNIAEGAGRNSNPDFIRFLSMSNGSCYELETQIIIAHKLSLISNIDPIVFELHELQKMNYKLQDYLKSNNVLKEPEPTYETSQYYNLNTQY